MSLLEINAKLASLDHFPGTLNVKQLYRLKSKDKNGNDFIGGPQVDVVRLTGEQMESVLRSIELIMSRYIPTHHITNL